MPKEHPSYTLISTKTPQCINAKNPQCKKTPCCHFHIPPKKVVHRVIMSFIIQESKTQSKSKKVPTLLRTGESGSEIRPSRNMYTLMFVGTKSLAALGRDHYSKAVKQNRS
jgi:hypothetical protein